MQQPGRTDTNTSMVPGKETLEKLWLEAFQESRGLEWNARSMFIETPSPEALIFLLLNICHSSSLISSAPWFKLLSKVIQVILKCVFPTQTSQEALYYVKNTGSLSRLSGFIYTPLLGTAVALGVSPHFSVPQYPHL